MTTHLPPLIHSPFTRSLDPNPYSYSHSYENPNGPDPLPSPTLSFFGRSRNLTSTSYPPTSPAQTRERPQQGENQSVNQEDVFTTPSKGISSIDLQSPPRPSLNVVSPSPRSLLLRAFEQTTAALEEDESIQAEKHGSVSCGSEHDDTGDFYDASSELCRDSTESNMGDDERERNLTITLHALEGLAEEQSASQKQWSGIEDEDGSSQFRRWADSFKRRRTKRARTPLTPTAFDLLRYDDWRPATRDRYSFQPQYTGHFKRASNASSSFLETVKTASVSAVSLSVAGRSARNSRASDSCGYRNSRQSASAGRASTESDNLQQASIVEEAATGRGAKRQQVLDEILASERGYVSDLKALANVFSTLLMSLPNVAPHVRSSIQRNIMEMLHLHEHLLVELDAASRNQGDKFKHAELVAGAPRRRLQSSGTSDGRLSLIPGNTMDTRIRPHHPRPTALAPPHAAAEVARVFKKLMPQFFVYEEYCAKYDIMIQAFSESNRTIPHWQAYESGIEALANSVIAIEERTSDGKKGLTVGDLLIKPIQRVCKYPLLIADLHKQTAVVDCPVSHHEIDGVLYDLRDTVKEINLATDDPSARERIQRTWLLQERLIFPDNGSTCSQFRILGHVTLCGILHVAYQTKPRVQGEYMLCTLFKAYMVLGKPRQPSDKFDVVAIIHLADLKVEAAEDNKGLQCHTALHSWKVVFESDNHLFELILSACCAAEEASWKAAIQEQSTRTAPEAGAPREAYPEISTCAFLDLKPAGPIFGQAGTLARRLSIQRAATVGTRNNPCQVIIRNTHRPTNASESREVVELSRSQSLLTTHRTVVLAPKRSDRIRLEQALADVYSRDVLPYPGMIGHRSGHLIRTSAGSLVRKLSSVNMHSPFSRRSMSLGSVPTKQSLERLAERPQTADLMSQVVNTVNRQVLVAATADPTLDQQIQQSSTLQASRRMSISGIRGLTRRGTIRHYRQSKNPFELPTEGLKGSELVEGKLDGRKRWSNPLGLLRNISSDGMRHLLYSTKTG